MKAKLRGMEQKIRQSIIHQISIPKETQKMKEKYEIKDNNFLELSNNY